MSEKGHVLITGGAGYIGSMLTAELLRAGYQVSVIDSLLYGGESLLAYFSHPNFHFSKGDITEPGVLRSALRKDWPGPMAVIHLAAIAGFPACQAIGKQAAWAHNVGGTRRVFEDAASLGVKRFIFASTYTGYGPTSDGQPADETASFTPRSLYAETKKAAEDFLLSAGGASPAPLIFRMATLYGISPRTRFDLLVNQFVLDAYMKRELVIYQRGYSRSFIHVRDVTCALLLGLETSEERARGQIYNLGSEAGNYSKDDIVGLVLKRLPETRVTYKDLSFGGEERDICVSFEKIRKVLGFQAELTVDDSVRETVFALQNGLIRNPQDEKYANARFIVQ
jgi:nucleoside-diphosphate-sugar epimerase